jgi:hypothetical protein
LHASEANNPPQSHGGMTHDRRAAAGTYQCYRVWHFFVSFRTPYWTSQCSGRRRVPSVNPILIVAGSRRDFPVWK